MEYKQMKSPFSKYYIFEDGRVYSEHMERFVKPYVTNKGYYSLNLWENNRVHKFLVHRLVAEYWCTKEHPEYSLVHHKDHDKQNNHHSNLEWTTYKGNLSEAKAHYGQKHYSRNNVVPVTAFRKGNNVPSVFFSIQEASRLTGVHVDIIYDIRRRKRKSNVVGEWTFIIK